jgi:hypothetical protein
MTKFVIAVGALAIALVALFGLYLFIKGVRNLQMASASTKWPTTSGQVIHSETTREVTEDDHNRSSVTFSTTTTIQYTVDGQDYTTSLLHFGQTLGSSDKSEAALLRLRFPEGKPVSVSYDPNHPATGVMKPGVHAEAFWLPGAGLAFLLPCVLCLIMGPSMIRGMKADAQSSQAFADSVESAIEAGRRGEIPRDIPPPSQSGGNSAMAMAAAFAGLVACALGVLALTAGYQRIWHGEASQRWPTTQGTVIVASTDEPDDTPGDTTDATAYARFVYEYEVAGTKHYNNLRRFAEVEGGSQEQAKTIATRYRKGAAVKVSYYPADPDVSVLEPGNTTDSLWLPGIGVVLILFSLAIFIWMVPALAT